MCLNRIHDKVVDIEAQSGNLLDTKVIFELGKRQTDQLKLNNTISKFKKFSMANRKENGNLVFGVAFKMIDAHATSATCNAYIVHEGRSEKISIPGKPSKPKVKLAQENGTSVSVSWEMPENSSMVTEFVVNYSTENNFQHITTIDLTTIVHNLQPNTSYIFKVYALCSKFGVQSEESEVSDAIRTGSINTSCSSYVIKTPSSVNVPAAPTNASFVPNLNAKDVTDNSLALQWKKPQKHLNLVNYNNVNASSQNASIATKTQLPLKLNDIQSNTITVADALCTTGQMSNESDLLSITTKQEVPDKPGRPEKLKATYNSITIKWTKPSNNAKFFKHYVISYSIKASTSSNHVLTCNVNPMECEQTQTDYVSTIPSLSPDTEYTIKLEAYCAKNIGVESETNCIKTEKAICSTPAKPMLTLLNETEYRVAVNWRAPSQYAELAQSYFVKYQIEGGGKWESIKSVQPFSTVIEGLKPDTSYVFGIVAVCESGCSDMSETSSIRTKPCAPGKPQEVKCTHNSIVLKWTAPCENESLIEHYIVIVYEEKKEIKQVETSNKKTNITICNLLPNTTYTFKVITVRNSIMSEESEESNPITTQPDIGILPSTELISKEEYEEKIKQLQEQLAMEKKMRKVQSMQIDSFSKQPLRKQNENLQENESKYT